MLCCEFVSVYFLCRIAMKKVVLEETEVNFHFFIANMNTIIILEKSPRSHQIK